MSKTSATTNDDLPDDLLEFLAQRHGMEVAAAAALLGVFLIEYEPQHAGPPSFASRRAA